MVKKIGITGGIGSGKSTICKIIQCMGYHIFNADKVAKEIINNDAKVISLIKEYFGDNSYQKDGTLNASYLSNIVFDNPEKLAYLNELVHPIVNEKFNAFVSHSNKAVFYEAAILFESQKEKNFDAILLVKAPLELRINRIIKRDGLSENEIMKRVNNQWDDKKKETLTPYCIINDEISPLLVQIEKIFTELCIC